MFVPLRLSGMSPFAATYQLPSSRDPVMAAEELVPDILAIVAARLKEQVWVKVQRWKVTTFMSTEGSKAHRPGGTGKNNNIKQLSYLTILIDILHQRKCFLLSYFL